jgi:outer membrane biosynthesis protein TonB
MSRTVAVIWHASFSIAAGVLYFFFVLPRWPELLGDTSHTLGTVLRIVAGAMIGLAALPVVFTLLRTRRPEFGTPQLALSLRTSSIALHVLAGALIIGTAISEIWLAQDDAGQWLFGIYGAAAAIALLGIFAFYLAYVAELPPPPPKPLKPKQRKQRRGRKAAEAEESEETTSEEEEEVTAEEPTSEEAEEESAQAEEAEDKPAEVTAVAEEPESTADEPESTAEDDAGADEKTVADEPAEEATNGRLRNRRPSGKTSPRRRRRLRGGVAVDD